MLTLVMAKVQLVARLAVELAPSSPLSSIIRRRRRRWVPRTTLDTIAEEEKEAPVPPPRRSVTGAAGSSAHAGGEKGKRCVGGRGDSSAVQYGEKRLVLGAAPPARAGRSKVESA